MAKYGINFVYNVEKKCTGFLLIRLSEVNEHGLEYFCKISKVLLNRDSGLQIDERCEKWKGLGFNVWQEYLFINKNYIFEFPDDETALLYVEVM